MSQTRFVTVDKKDRSLNVHTAQVDGSFSVPPKNAPLEAIQEAMKNPKFSALMDRRGLHRITSRDAMVAKLKAAGIDLFD